MPSSLNLSRPVQIDSPQAVLDLVRRGYTDDVLDDLEKVIRARRATRRHEALALIRREFGDEAVKAALAAADYRPPEN